tara:strand:- start:386 stop:841 length:456 start_codon:yes stop_codon:yes gene_type:complete
MTITQSLPTKNKIEIRTTNTRFANEDSLFSRIDGLTENYRFLNFYTIKGRIEFSKDYKGVLWAISQTPGISEVFFQDGEISISWCINLSFLTESESINYTKEYVLDFISNLNKVKSVKYLEDLGIEVHVFIGSLKPIDEYDGERNGPFCDF